MEFKRAYLYSLDQKKRTQDKKKVLLILLSIALVVILVLLKGVTIHGEGNTIQKGTHGSFEARNGCTGSRGTETNGQAGTETTGIRRGSTEVGTGKAEHEGLIPAVAITGETVTLLENNVGDSLRTSGTGLTSLGTFRLTAYCACVKCCGKEPGDPAYGITASGERVKENWTVAADPEVIPIGTLIQINGQVYRVEDVGGLVKGNTVDIYMATHEAALDFGVQEAEVFILEGGNN